MKSRDLMMTVASSKIRVWSDVKYDGEKGDIYSFSMIL